MRQPLRFFSIGLLVASILLYGYYFFFVSSKVTETELETDELIAQIEEKGYRVISEDDYLSFTFLKQQEEEKEAQTDQNDKNEADEDTDNGETEKTDKEDVKEKELKKQDEKKEEDKEKEVKKHTFTTDENVVSQKVADVLLDNGIIDDKQAFQKYLDDNNYSSYIQIGTFTVSSDMSFKEIAEIITTYPGN